MKRFQAYENSLLRRIFDLIRNEVIGGKRKLFLVTRVMVCSFHQIVLGRAGKDYSRPKYTHTHTHMCVCVTRGERKNERIFQLETPKGRCHLET